MSTVLLDFETTGLMQPRLVPLEKQPHAIELYALRVEEATWSVTESLDQLIYPTVPLPPEIPKITGLTDKDLKGCPEFKQILPQLIDLVLGATRIVAHNLPFDCGVLACELERLGMEYQFPWPPLRYCTVEHSMHILGRRMNLKTLYKHCTGKDHTGAHRAKADVLALLECYKWLRADEEKKS